MRFLVLLLLLVAAQAQAQRVLPKSLKWTNAYGFYLSPFVSTAYQSPVSPLMEEGEPMLGYGLGLKSEYAVSPLQRAEFGGGFLKRTFRYVKPATSNRLGLIDTISTNFLMLYARYKLMVNGPVSSFYLAPGLSFDTELNHPIINSNTSGMGITVALGYEYRLPKGIVLFAEIDARATSLWHFKNEDFPWRHNTLGINFGLLYTVL